MSFFNENCDGDIEANWWDSAIFDEFFYSTEHFNASTAAENFKLLVQDEKSAALQDTRPNTTITGGKNKRSDPSVRDRLDVLVPSRSKLFKKVMFDSLKKFKDTSGLLNLQQDDLLKFQIPLQFIECCNNAQLEAFSDLTRTICCENVTYVSSSGVSVSGYLEMVWYIGLMFEMYPDAFMRPLSLERVNNDIVEMKMIFTGHNIFGAAMPSVMKSVLPALRETSHKCVANADKILDMIASALVSSRFHTSDRNGVACDVSGIWSWTFTFNEFNKVSSLTSKAQLPSLSVFAKDMVGSPEEVGAVEAV